MFGNYDFVPDISQTDTTCVPLVEYKVKSIHYFTSVDSEFLLIIFGTKSQEEMVESHADEDEESILSPIINNLIMIEY